MGLNGLIVTNPIGTPIYANVSGTKLDEDTTLVDGFLAAIRSTSSQFITSSSLGIEEMVLKNFKILYRHLDLCTFIGIFDLRDTFRNAEPAMEFIVYAFLAKYRKHVHGEEAYSISTFLDFDTFLNGWRNAKDKDMRKWAEAIRSSPLQRILNKLVDFFPIRELVKISPSLLKNVGQHLILVDHDITNDMETQILAELKNKTDVVYGPEMFDNLEKDVKKQLEAADISEWR